MIEFEYGFARIHEGAFEDVDDWTGWLAPCFAFTFTAADIRAPDLAARDQDQDQAFGVYAYTSSAAALFLRSYDDYYYDY